MNQIQEHSNLDMHQIQSIMALREAFFNMGDHGIKGKHAYKRKDKQFKQKEIVKDNKKDIFLKVCKPIWLLSRL